MTSRSCDPLELRKMLVSDRMLLCSFVYCAGSVVNPEAVSLHPQPSTSASTTVDTLGRIPGMT